MFNDLEEMFRKVITLARLRRINHERFGVPVHDVDENNLERYLRRLNFEQIKILQCIMYLGRDEDYYETETPEERYGKFRAAMDRRGWNDDKDIEMYQMLEKEPLDEYLENGLKILKIDL